MSSFVRPLALALALTPALAAPLYATDAPQATNLDRIEVSESTMRMPRSQGALPMTITVIDPADLTRQMSITPDLGDAIGALVPSYSPSTQKLSVRGQTLRGRNPLYMIDGVPQSSP